MPQQLDYLSELVKTAFPLGVSEGVPEDMKRRTLIQIYFLPKAIVDLQDSIENAQRISEYAVIATQSAFIVGNVGLAAGGLYIAGVSTQNYLQTKNTIAKFCYGASICCSGTAAISGTIKAFGSTCGLSSVAMCGDAFGTSFLFLGNRARDLGDLAEGKTKNPFHNLRNRSFRRARISKGSGDSLAFLTDRSWSSDTAFSQGLTAIPYQKIIIIGGSILTIYAYGKFIISTYHYGQKLVSKFIAEKKIKSSKLNSKLIRKQSVFLINSLTNTHLQSQLRIYKFALSSQVLIDPPIKMKPKIG